MNTRRNKYLPYSQLDFGEIKDHSYENELIKWRLRFPNSFEATLNNNEQRKKSYDLSTSDLILNSIEEINENIRWTRLIQLNNIDQIENNQSSLHSAIRKIAKNENPDFKQEYFELIDNRKSDERVKAQFDYILWSESINDLTFECIEFSEIISYGRTFGNPHIIMSTLLGDIILQINISFATKAMKDELIQIIRNSEFN